MIKMHHSRSVDRTAKPFRALEDIMQEEHAAAAPHGTIEVPAPGNPHSNKWGRFNNRGGGNANPSFNYFSTNSGGGGRGPFNAGRGKIAQGRGTCGRGGGRGYALLLIAR
ncbi:hypothetical protein WJX77_006508 [Trebouxia sp. C0004]